LATTSRSCDHKPKEQRAAELYRGLAGAATDASFRSLFEDPARLELRHKTRIGGMFVDIGDPEAF